MSLLAMVLSNFSYAQLQVDTNFTPQQLVQNILIGSGVTASNITYTGASISIGSFSGGNTTNIGLDAGIIISTGKVTDAIGPNTAQNTQTNTFGGSDPQLQALVPGDTLFDAVALEFDFVPMSDTIRFQYVFASEEYEEWVGSTYNDVFGFFVTGANPAGGNYNSENLAVLPGTSTAVSVNTINNGPYGNGPCNNCSYYINNSAGTTIEYDGFTVILTSWLVVTPCSSYHIKLAIADAGDPSYDSGVFLKKNSFSSAIIHLKTDYSANGIKNTAVEACNDAVVSMVLDYPSPYNRVVHYSIGGTAQNGVDYQQIPDSIVIPQGVDSVGIDIVPIIDGIAEGTEYVQLIIETSACSNDTIIVPISDYNPVNVNISSTFNAFCNGQASSLTANASSGFAPYSYLWSNSDTNSVTSVVPTSNTSYNVKVTDACGVTAADTIPIIVYQPPTISASVFPTTICKRDSSNLKVNGANTYVWTPNTNISSNIGDSIFAWPNSTTNYTVVGTDIHGCKDTAQLSLTVLPLPNIQSGPHSASICLGDSLNLSANGGVSYLWKPYSSLSDSTSVVVNAKPDTTTRYVLEGIGANGCSNYDTSIITVNNLPNIQVSPNSPSMCEGANEVLTASGASTYFWVPSTGLSSNNTASVTAGPNTTTTYIVKGTDANSCENLDTVTLTVYQNPTVTVNPTRDTICEGGTIALSANGASTYFWAPSSGLSSQTGQIVTASPNSNISYSVIGTDAFGCSDTAISNINVTPKPIIIASDTLICGGDSSILNATAVLSGTTYLWSNGDTTQSITVKPNVTTTYFVTATNASCSGVDSIIIYISQPPVLSILPNNSTICFGGSASVTASGAVTYSWTPTTNNSSPNSATTLLSPTITTTYYLSAANSIGCISSDSTLITVNSLPNVSVSPVFDSICNGDSTQLSASGALAYSWSPSIALSSATGSTVHTRTIISRYYYVTGVDANGCSNTDTAHVFVSPVISLSASPSNVCLGDSIHLSVSSNVNSTYNWNTGDNVSSFWTTPVGTTSYSVTVTADNGCDDDATITVNTYNRPTVSVTPNSATVCNGSTELLTASGATTYSWMSSLPLSSNTGTSVDVTATSTANVRVIGTDASGCADTTFASITMVKAPQVQLNNTVDTSCSGTPVTFIASPTATSIPIVSYLWSPSVGLSTNTGSTVVATPPTTKTYKVVVTSANGCQDSINAKLLINPKPVILINTSNSDLCFGDSVLLTTTGADSYIWSPSSGLSNTSGSSVTATPSVGTHNYSIIGTTNLGCKDTTNSVVNVYSYPTVSVTADQQICPRASTNITANGATTYTWSPATYLSSINGSTVSSSPDSSISYSVIGDSHGCTDTAYTSIIVSPLPKISGESFICMGNSTTLFVNSNLSNTTYQWNSGGATTDSIVVSPVVSTTYIVTATDATMAICTNTDTFVVAVNSLPTVSVNPTDITICPGTSTNITASGGNSYHWSPSTGLSDTVSATVTASPIVETTYTVVGSTPQGCHDTVRSIVRLFSQPNVTVNPVTSYTCGGNSQTLTASGASSYSWAPATNLSSNVGVSVSASPNSNTNYIVTGTDANSCTDTAIAHVNIYGKPVFQPVNPNKCPEDTILLMASTQNMPISYLWNTGSTSQSVYAGQSVNTNYSVTVTYAAGCVKTDSVSVDIYNEPSVVASTLTPFICVGDTADLLATNGVSFSWSGLNLLSNTVNNPKANPTVNSTYFVEAVSSNGCKTIDSIDINMHPLANINIVANPNQICIGDTAQLVATGGNVYSWSPNTSLNSTTNDTVLANPSSSITYQVIGTNGNGCRDTASQYIYVNFGPNISITKTKAVFCQGDTIGLIGHGASNYHWSPNYAIYNQNSDTAWVHPPSMTNYYVRGYDAMGCYNDTSILVTVKRKPIINVVPSFDSICSGDSILVVAMGVPYFTWKPYNSLTDSIGDSLFASPLVTTTYIITGTSTDGCTKEIASTIKVNPNPSMSITPVTQGLCIWDTTHIEVNGALTYDWSPQYNISTNILKDSAFVNPIIPTTYQVVGTNIFGCKDSLTSFVDIYQLPNVTVSPANPSICFNDSVELIAPPNNVYSWTPSSTLDNGNTDSVWASPHANITYLLTGIDTNNCVNRDTIDVIVHPEIFPTVSPENDSICYGLATTLIAGGGVDYSWSPSTGLSATDTAIVMANPSTSQTYTVKVFDAFGCSDSIQSKVTVLVLPSLTITPPSTAFCYGLQDTLEVSGALSYAWSPNSDINTIIGDSVIVDPLTTRYYVVEGTDSLGCIRVDSALVTVYQLPPVKINPRDTLVCYGDSTNLIATGANQYVWSPATGLSTTTGDSVNTTVNVDITYYLTGTDTNTCVNYDSVQIYTGPKPVMSIAITDTLICEGRYIGLSGSSNQNPTEFVWSTGDTSVTSSDNPTTNITYTLYGKTPLGCTDSAQAYVQVNPFPVLHLSPQDSLICDGDSVEIISIQNLNNMTYTWTTGQTTPNINVKPLSNTSYKLVVSDSIGCSDTAVSNINLQPIPNVFITSNNSHVCENDSVILTANPTDSLVSYTWNIGPANKTNYYNPTVNTTFGVVITDSVGCQNSDSIEILVNPIPQMYITPRDSFICIYDTTILTASSSVSTLNYLWNTSELTTNISVNPLTNTVYTVYGTDSIGCTDSTSYLLTVHALPLLTITPSPANICYGDSVQLMLSSNVSLTQYIWNTSNTQQNIWVAPLSNSGYSVTATDIYGCVNDTDNTVYVHPNPIINIAPNESTICSDSSLQLEVTTNIPAQHILWTSGDTVYNPILTPMVTSSFSVVLIDTNGCYGYDTSLVNVIQRVTCNLTATSPVCSIDTAKVEYSGTATSAALVNWDFDGGTLVSGSGISPHFLQWSTAGIYKVILDVTENGCTSWPDTAEITIHQSPEVHISSVDSIVCDSLPVMFSSMPSGMMTYLWNFGDPLAGANDTSSLQNPDYVYHVPGTYSVNLMVVSPNGCTGFAQQNSMILINPSPGAGFQLNPKVSFTTPVINFYDQSVGANSWEWDFGDPNSGIFNFSNNSDPYHIYQEKGEYTVRQIVTNNFGCVDTAWATAILDNAPSLFVPDAFTPNGDGLNDVFIPKGTKFDVSSFELYIYDRWGRLVFETKDYYNFWDGTHYKTGDELNSDVFNYIIYTVDSFDKKHIYKGSITLIR